MNPLYQNTIGRFTQGEQDFNNPSVNLPVNSSPSYASIFQPLVQSIPDRNVTNQTLDSNPIFFLGMAAFPPNPFFRGGNRTEVERVSVQYWSNSTMPSPSSPGVADGDYARNLQLLAKFQEDLRLVTDRYEHVRSRKGRIAAKVLYLKQKLGIVHQDPVPELLGPCNSTGPAPSLKSTGPGECDKHIVTAAGLSFIVALLLVGLFTAIVRLCSGARKSEVREIRHSEGRGGSYGRDPPQPAETPRFVKPHYHIEVTICSHIE